MTQHVRMGYRNHRKATWGAVAVVAAVLAATLTPFATGAPPKLYTLTADPPSVCFVGPGEAETFTLTLTNEARNNTLGSANVTAPSYAVLVDSSATVSPRGSATVNVETNTVELRDLALATGEVATVTVQAVVSIGDNEAWTSVVKQSNDFADAPGPGNLFAPRGDPPPLTVAACEYVFTNGTPTDALRNVAQTVTVELQADGVTVPGTGTLDLVAYQGQNNTTTPLAEEVFTGLDTTAASGIWTFSQVTGTVSGTDFRLRIQGTDTFSTYFTIADCVPTQSGSCDIPFTPSDETGSSGASVSGTQIASPIALSFEMIPDTGAGKCDEGWGWSPLTFPEQPDGSTTFDGLTLSDFSYAQSNGFLKVTTYLRNDLFVQTNPSNTNDILICAGGRHSAGSNGADNRAFMGRGGVLAKWDAGTNLYWGVLERIPNCNRARDLNNDGILDPALCAWGTADIGGVIYRTATVLVPYDWDWKGFG